jgi:hypothetical protein
VKRHIAAVVATTAVTLALMPGVAQAATTGWWHTAGFTAANTGFNPYEPTLTPSAVPNLRLRGSVVGDRIAPVLDDGRVYATSGGLVRTTSESTGSALWQWDAGNTWPNATITATVVLDDAFVVSLNESGRGHVVVLRSGTGDVIRTIDHDGPIATLLVDKGVILVSSGVENPNGSDSAAYRLTDGVKLWDDPTLYLAKPVSANGTVLLRGVRSGINWSEARDLVTGAAVWRTANTQYDALAADDTGAKFFIAWGHSLQFVEANTGALGWLGNYVYPTDVTVSPTRLYVTTRENKLSVFRTVTTENPPYWTLTFAAKLAKPAIAGGVLYVTIADGRVLALDPVTGTTLNTPKLTGAVPPVVTNGRLYLAPNVYGL